MAVPLKGGGAERSLLSNVSRKGFARDVVFIGQVKAGFERWPEGKETDENQDDLGITR
jgi:hypothetical protein